MPCWVVPSVAAEIWGISLKDVLNRIAAGELPTHRENDWLFVDVYPDGPAIELVKNAPRERPPTFVAVGAEDRPSPGDSAGADDGEEASPDPEPEVSVFRDWRTARRRTARLRLAPPRFVEI